LPINGISMLARIDKLILSIDSIRRQQRSSSSLIVTLLPINRISQSSQFGNFYIKYQSD
jgi:hypothetical protein